jgi:glycosyltransferase involved in cell wall biosynthesis
MPVENPKEILLVTPVWNDSARLAGFGVDLAAVLSQSPLPIRWIIADDGSGAGEDKRLEELRDQFSKVYPRVEVHFAKGHFGKGAVVRDAWSLGPDADWLAFVDADGSVSAEEMIGLIGKAVASGDSVIGVRKRTATTRIVESPWRGFAHRGFLLAAHLLLDLQCEDVQCGAKVIHGGDYRHIAHRLSEDGLAFDSELLATLKKSGADWQEVPVNWIEKKGGKVKPLRHAWGMFNALLRIRSRDW